MKPGIVLAVLTISTCQAFLPGIKQVTYCKPGTADDECSNYVSVLVNRLDSKETIIPYNYDHFDFCRVDPNFATKTYHENIGQIVFGERILYSPYNITFGVDQQCVKVCQKTYKRDDATDASKLDLLKTGIFYEYEHHWILDNLPIIRCFKNQNNEVQCNNGFPIGCYVSKTGDKKQSCLQQDESGFTNKDSFYLFNHVDITIQYHPSKDTIGAGVIVGAVIEPKSRLRNGDGPSGCGSTDKLVLNGRRGKNAAMDLAITYTYSVRFTEEPEVEWASRWDHILKTIPSSQIQWFSIINSLVIVLFLAGMLGMILLRTLHKDISKYNQMDSSDDAIEEFGWKLVHGDVFRPPRKGMLLSVFLGTGTQVICMVMFTLFFVCMGFISPAHRGGIMTVSIVVFVLLGTPAGYVSSRMYKSFGGMKWKSNVILTAFLCPGILFSIFFLINIVLWANHSSAGIPFLTLCSLVAMWFLISVPLTFVGAYLGFKRSPIEHPVRTNQIPRQIPEQSCWTRPVSSILMGGILPFGCIFIQLYFIFSSIWSHQVFYMFGLLFAVTLILMLTCGQAAVLLCYFHLCSEDYHWWWRSFMTAGSTGIYLFFFCINYYNTKLEMEGFTSAFLYFSYTLILVFLFMLFTGTIGFFACFWFVTKIYSVVKVD